jgi:hypothetical protein
MWSTIMAGNLAFWVDDAARHARDRPERHADQNHGLEPPDEHPETARRAGNDDWSGQSRLPRAYPAGMGKGHHEWDRAVMRKLENELRPLLVEWDPIGFGEDLPLMSTTV